MRHQQKKVHSLLNLKKIRPLTDGSTSRRKGSLDSLDLGLLVYCGSERFEYYAASVSRSEEAGTRGYGYLRL
jgi:hypothetical protein